MGDVKKHHTQINSSRKKVLTKVQHPRDASIQGSDREGTVQGDLERPAGKVQGKTGEGGMGALKRKMCQRVSSISTAVEKLQESYAER